MRSVTVLIVEDSAVARELLVETLNADPRITVIGTVGSGEAAVTFAEHLAPDVVTMDVRLPGISGIEATRRIMAACPTPVIVVSDLSASATASAMEALRAGALLVVEKPALDSQSAYRALARRLCDQVVGASTLKVVRRRFESASPSPAPGAGAHPSPALSPIGPVEIVGIVASTGGPPAVASLLSALGDSFAAPILLVQHMGAGFLPGYADWLASVTRLDVRLAADGETVAQGCIYLAPGGTHLVHRSGALHLTPETEAGVHVPSGDALFTSLAASVGPRAVGVILTGMGDDGARGLLALHETGAITIAQDRATSVVYGMPAAAGALGAVSEELPLDQIAPRLVALVGPKQGERRMRRNAR